MARLGSLIMGKKMIVECVMEASKILMVFRLKGYLLIQCVK